MKNKALCEQLSTVTFNCNLFLFIEQILVENVFLKFCLSKRKIIDNRVDMDTIRHHVDRLRIEEERSRLPQRKEEDEGEESFEEVIGSGLTSETEGHKATTPKSKPKTIPGHRVKDQTNLQIKENIEEKKPSRSNELKLKKRKKTGKTEVSLKHDDVVQTTVTEIEFLMPKTSENFEKLLANMKHIPQAAKPPPSKFKIPATSKIQSNQMVALPPLIADSEKTQKPRLKHQFQAEYDKFADKEFYKDFRFTFFPLPLPTEELPRKSVRCLVA